MKGDDRCEGNEIITIKDICRAKLIGFFNSFKELKL